MRAPSARKPLPPVVPGAAQATLAQLLHDPGKPGEKAVGQRAIRFEGGSTCTARFRAGTMTLPRVRCLGSVLAGPELTAADIMTVFPLTTMRSFKPYDLSPWPNILAYLQRIGARPAYQRAMRNADADMTPLLGATP